MGHFPYFPIECQDGLLTEEAESVVPQAKAGKQQTLGESGSSLTH